MLHNGLLDLMNRSTCFGHYCAHHQELATIQMVRGMFHDEVVKSVVKHPSNRTLQKPTAMHQTSNLP